MTPRIISLDIETYGIARRDWWDRPLPPQRCFNPRGSLVHDGVPRESMILTAAITIPKEDPRPCHLQSTPPLALNARSAGPISTSEWVATMPSSASGALPCSDDSWSSWNLERIGKLQPGKTMVFKMHLPAHRSKLRQWLLYANTLLGMNLQFDLQYLRMFSEFRHALTPSQHTIIDLSVLNFLHSELRPERSLKNLGPVLGTHLYPESETRRDRAYEKPNDLLVRYNGADTHNTLLASAYLARCIARDYPRSDKLCPYSVRFYSDAIWSCVRMSEAGIPVNVEALIALEDRLRRVEAANSSLLLRKAALQMGGKGSDKSKRQFMETSCDIVDSISQSSASSTLPPSVTVFGPQATGTNRPSASTTSASVSTTPTSVPRTDAPTEPPALSVRSHRLMEVTDLKHELRFTQQNRNLIAHHLPADHPHHAILRSLTKVSEAQKLISTYTYPLLRHNRKKPYKWEDRLTPWPPTPPPSSSSVTRYQRSLLSSGSPTDLLPLDLPKSGADLTLEALSSAPPSIQRPLSRLSARFSELKGTQRKRLLKRLCALQWENVTSEPIPLCPPLQACVHYARLRSSPPIALAIPNWLVVPTHPKDGLGDEGGTKQGRIIAKAAGRPQTWPPRLKGCIQSRFGEQGVIVQGDLRQIEPRLAALLSGETSMITVFQRGGDIHADTAIQLLGPEVTKSPHWKSGDMRTDPRQWGKTGGLLILYRGGWAKAQSTVLTDSGILLTDELCQEIVNGMRVARPILWAWQDRLIEETHARGYMILPFTGQSRYYMGGTDYDVNEIVNTPIQTYAGDTLLRIQAACEPHLPNLNTHDPDVYLCHNWYDALYLDCRNSRVAAESGLALQQAVDYVSKQDLWAMLQDHYGNEVPLEIDIKEL